MSTILDKERILSVIKFSRLCSAAPDNTLRGEGTVESSLFNALDGERTEGHTDSRRCVKWANVVRCVHGIENSPGPNARWSNNNMPLFKAEIRLCMNGKLILNHYRGSKRFYSSECSIQCNLIPPLVDITSTCLVASCKQITSYHSVFAPEYSKEVHREGWVL
jgi:hypothetical protein